MSIEPSYRVMLEELLEAIDSRGLKISPWAEQLLRELYVELQKPKPEATLQQVTELERLYGHYRGL